MYKLTETMDVRQFRELLPRFSSQIVAIIADSVDAYYPGIGRSLYVLKEPQYTSSGWEKRTLLCFAWCFGASIPTEYAIHYGTRSETQIQELYGDRKVRGIDIGRLLRHQQHWTHKQWHERLDRNETIYESEETDISWIRGVPSCVDLAERYIWPTIQPYIDKQLTYSVMEYYPDSAVTTKQLERARMWTLRAPSVEKMFSTTNMNEILRMCKIELALSCICVRCAIVVRDGCVCCKEVLRRVGNLGTHPRHAIAKLNCESMGEWEQRCRLFADSYINTGCVFYGGGVVVLNYI